MSITTIMATVITPIKPSLAFSGRHLMLFQQKRRSAKSSPTGCAN
jgi:hypothetical protein